MSNDIRRKRTENYFIEALCDIIRNEGMGSATIRNVASKAGYNSATIYSYFKEGVEIQTINQIHQACLSLTVGTVLLHLKERFSNLKEEVLNGLAVQIKFLIENQMSRNVLGVKNVIPLAQ